MSYTVEIVVPEDAELEEAGETISLEVEADEHVLAVARREGLWLPADCQKGWCITCAARLLEGEVDQTNARRYYDVDEKEGFILPCTAKPRSDLRIECCQYDEMLRHRADHDKPPGRSKL